jgi:hypothetical protein
MWPRILAFLESPEPEMRLGGIWIAGTSVQNNPKSKVAVSERVYNCLYDSFTHLCWSSLLRKMVC